MFVHGNLYLIYTIFERQHSVFGEIEFMFQANNYRKIRSKPRTQFNWKINHSKRTWGTNLLDLSNMKQKNIRTMGMEFFTLQSSASDRKN